MEIDDLSTDELHMAAKGFSTEHLVDEARSYLSAYEEPQSYFTGHNKMAVLMREALARLDRLHGDGSGE